VKDIGGMVNVGEGAGRCVMLCVLAAVAAISGCAERIITITSEPSDALVTLNDVQVGRTPVEVDFTYFGVYDVRLVKDGFEPLATTAEAKAPFHEWPVVDLAAAMVPVRKKTRIDWHFVLTPADESRDALLQRAGELRSEMSKDAAPAGAETQGGR
jgi:hypothetical protein